MDFGAIHSSKRSAVEWQRDMQQLYRAVRYPSIHEDYTHTRTHVYVCIHRAACTYYTHHSYKRTYIHTCIQKCYALVRSTNRENQRKWQHKWSKTKMFLCLHECVLALSGYRFWQAETFLRGVFSIYLFLYLKNQLPSIIAGITVYFQ